MEEDKDIEKEGEDMGGAGYEGEDMGGAGNEGFPIETISYSDDTENLSQSLFGESVAQVKRFITPLSKIIQNRISAPQTCSIWIPLTSRAVEGMFSEWRRKTQDNSEIRATSMQMRLFLKIFSAQELIYILETHPLTPAITKVLLTLKDRDLTRAQRDE
jgi:hypothetical protein